MSSHDAASLDDSRRIDRTVSATERISSEAAWLIYEPHAKELMAFLIGVLRDPHEATEVSQIVFQRLLESGHQSRTESQKHWLFKVALREAQALKRKAANRDRHLKSYFQIRDGAIDVSSSEFDLIRAEEITRLKQFFTQLPIDQKQIVQRRFYEDKSFATIAAELKVPLGTVLSRMRLALDKLRKWLGNDE